MRTRSALQGFINTFPPLMGSVHSRESRRTAGEGLRRIPQRGKTLAVVFSSKCLWSDAQEWASVLWGAESGEFGGSTAELALDGRIPTQSLDAGNFRSLAFRGRLQPYGRTVFPYGRRGLRRRGARERDWASRIPREGVRPGRKCRLRRPREESRWPGNVVRHAERDWQAP